MPITVRYTNGADYDPSNSILATPAIPDGPGFLQIFYTRNSGSILEWSLRDGTTTRSGSFVHSTAGAGLFIDASTSSVAVRIFLNQQPIFASTLIGSAFADEITVGSNLNDGGAATWLFGGGGDDVLGGGGDDDELDGGEGDDILTGAGGSDRLDGGSGDDELRVDSFGDIVIEAVGDGHDRVLTSTSYILPEDAEIEELSTISFGVQSFLLIGNGFANTITGSDDDDRLEGGGGDDVLQGGAGDDTLVGGAGNDLYRVGSAGDVVIETDAVGIDTIETRVSMSLDAAARIERLVAAVPADVRSGLLLVGNRYTTEIVGSAYADALIGGSGHETLSGGAGSDRIDGGAGNDTLDGRAGADAMAGGAGNDLYVVDHARDRVSEAAGAGRDTVRTSLARYALTANVEDLASDGFASTGAAGVTFFGNELANRIAGSKLNDILYDTASDAAFRAGIAGVADQLTGGSGDDLYRVTNAGSRVIEADKGGIDTVEATVTYRLPANVENLTLIDVKGAVDAFGNAGDNRLTGNLLVNRMIGGEGADVLDGGGGADLLIGGAGRDVFSFAQVADSRPDARDLITDFVKGTDRIDLTRIDASGEKGVQPFAWIGDAKFSKTAGELRYEFVGQQTIVSGDVDGDAIADFQFAFNRQIALAKEDFLF